MSKKKKAAQQQLLNDLTEATMNPIKLGYSSPDFSSVQDPFDKAFAQNSEWQRSPEREKLIAEHPQRKVGYNFAADLVDNKHGPGSIMQQLNDYEAGHTTAKLKEESQKRQEAEAAANKANARKANAPKPGTAEDLAERIEYEKL